MAILAQVQERRSTGKHYRANEDDGFSEMAFADDLNVFKAFDDHVINDVVEQELHVCQVHVRLWGASRQVVFDENKECACILSRREPMGDEFEILRIYCLTLG